MMEDSVNSTSTSYHLRTQLPLTRVKKIFRLDSNCTTISSEALQLLTFVTERFVGLLAKSAYGQATFDKRKTVQLRDLEFCIKNYEPFNFLNGTLDGWPEPSGGKCNTDNGSSISMAAKTMEGISSADVDEEEENLNVDINNLNNEIFDESVKETTSIESPLDGQIIKKLNNVVTAKNAEIVDIFPEAQNLRPEVFGHYGYHFPVNSTIDTGKKNSN